MPTIVASPLKEAAGQPSLVGCCGLYCGGCGAYLIRRCAGCQAGGRTAGCKVRDCCHHCSYDTCAECAAHADPLTCATYLNSVNGSSGFLMRSKRAACIEHIKVVGMTTFAKEMAAAHRPSGHH